MTGEHGTGTGSARTGQSHEAPGALLEDALWAFRRARRQECHRMAPLHRRGSRGHTAQNDERHAAEGLPAYAWQLAHGGDVTAKNAAEVARILTAADRKLSALSERYGPSATFGQYLARVADVLSIRAAMVPASSAYTTATGSSWRQCTPAEAGAWLDDREAAYRKACAERVTL